MTPNLESRVGTTRPASRFAKSFTNEDDDNLREILKRCPVSAYEAACRFRKTSDPQCIPPVVLGIIERYVESGLRPKLRLPHEHLCLAEDLGLDSLSLMEIIILIEDALAITVNNDEPHQLRTLGDVSRFIESKLRHPLSPEPRAERSA